MRLNSFERESIKNVFHEVFGNGCVYLFGSRTDDTKRGGDIDLYIIPAKIENISSKKIDFLVKLKRAIGEQKIDIVIDTGSDRLIDVIAKQEGVLLCQN